MRGLERVRGECLLDCMCHNVLKLFRHGPATAALVERPPSLAARTRRPSWVITWATLADSPTGDWLLHIVLCIGVVG